MGMHVHPWWIHVNVWQNQYKLKKKKKNPPANAGDLRGMSSVPAWGGSPGGGHCNLLQISCLENPMDRGAWWATVRGVAKSWTRLK